MRRISVSSSFVKPKSSERSTEMSATSWRGLSIIASSEMMTATSGASKKPPDCPASTGTPSRASTRRQTGPETFTERSSTAMSP